MRNRSRDINWLEHASRSLSARIPEVRHCSLYVSSRLSALLLERLPPETANAVLELLPNGVAAIESLRASADSEWNPSIGFHDFLVRSATSLGVSRFEAPDIERLASDVAEAFLWAVAQEVPPELKDRLQEALPAEIHLRMNLTTASSEESRVA